MAEMKDSGIEWCGKIPISWNVMPNKYVMHKKKEICPKYNGEDILSLTMDGVIVRDLDAGGKMPASFDGYQRVHPHNLLMCLFDYDVTPRCIGLIQNEGLTSPAYSQFVMKNGNDARYYYYYYLMIDNTKELLHLAKNLRHSFTEDQLGIINTPVPPVEIQKKIAKYLDQKCEDIDAVYVEIEKQIETLEEYKKSIITEAVTKGLDPDVEMKDSGISIIGHIPRHYKLIPLKYMVDYNSETLPDGTENDYEFDYIDIGSVTYGRGIEQLQRMKFKDAPSRARRVVKKDDVILSTVRTYLKATAAIPSNNYPVIVSTGFITLTAKKELFPNYLKYAIQYDGFISDVESRSVGISYPAINSTEAVRIKIIVPPINEQKEISLFLDKKCTDIDEAINDKKQQLETLEQYKKSLIYEYVTGKKEVPDYE